MGHRADSRRFQRRRGGRAGIGDDALRDRHRPVGLDSSARTFLRGLWAEANRAARPPHRPDPRPSRTAAASDHVVDWTDGALGRRPGFLYAIIAGPDGRDTGSGLTTGPADF